VRVSWSRLNYWRCPTISGLGRTLFVFSSSPFLAQVLDIDFETLNRPLVPSACHTAELKFVPLTTGLLRVEGVRVVDLNSNETTDCRDLPSIVSVGKRG
jgi:hypothetical protein